MLPAVSVVTSQLSAGTISVLLALNHFPNLFPAWFSFPMTYFSCISPLGEVFLNKKNPAICTAAKGSADKPVVELWWMVSAAGCVLCLSQGGAGGEGASQAAFVPFVPKFNIPRASPQHHPCTGALLAQWSPSKYHHFDFTKIKREGNVPPVDFPDGFGSLLCLEEVWLILSCCLSPCLPACL